MAIDKIQSESINLADNFAFTGTVTGAGGANTPAFKAYYDGTQTINNNSATKVTVYGTEEYDTDNAFASSRFTVPSGKAGRYMFFASISDDSANENNTKTITMYLYKNGSASIGNNTKLFPSYAQMQVFGHDTLAEGDYVEVYVYQSTGSSISFDGNERVFFSGFRLIE